VVTVKCAWCDKEMLRHPYRVKRTPNQFCCSQHRIEWMRTVKGEEHWLYNHETRICLNCGEEFSVFPSEKKKYCSLPCYYKHKTQRQLCVVCGQQVNRKGNKYCSRECMGIDRRSRIKKKCPVCGKMFIIRPCEDRGDNNVCSKDCSDKLKTLKPFYSDQELTEYLLSLHKKLERIPDLNDLRQEMDDNPNALHWALYVRRGGLRYWQKKLFGKTTYRFVWESRCIDLFNSALEYPDFIAQKTFPWLKNYNNGKSRPGSLRVDVFYPRYNLCVEFDGEGHFQEINWKKGGDDTLQKVRERDELKTKLIEEHGLHLIRFRYDEPMTTEYVKKLLENYI